jgi:hypothetical protein
MILAEIEFYNVDYAVVSNKHRYTSLYSICFPKWGVQNTLLLGMASARSKGSSAELTPVNCCTVLRVYDANATSRHHSITAVISGSVGTRAKGAVCPGIGQSDHPEHGTRFLWIQAVLLHL